MHFCSSHTRTFAVIQCLFNALKKYVDNMKPCLVPLEVTDPKSALTTFHVNLLFFCWFCHNWTFFGEGGDITHDPTASCPISTILSRDLNCDRLQEWRLPSELRLTRFPYWSKDEHKLRAEPTDTGPSRELHRVPCCGRVCSTAEPPPALSAASSTPSSPESLRHSSGRCGPSGSPAEPPLRPAATAGAFRHPPTPLHLPAPTVWRCPPGQPTSPATTPLADASARSSAHRQPPTANAAVLRRHAARCQYGKPVARVCRDELPPGLRWLRSCTATGRVHGVVPSDKGLNSR
uniref:RNA helicase n=1 Tax=Mesocestoides corti TaxID=53468 RepID=A0A5K3EW05_MESCO